MSHPAIEFRKVSVRYEQGSLPILAAVSFVVQPGERVALVGLNGSGKTTLLAAAVGLVSHEGEIHIAGERLTRRSVVAMRERIGFVFNTPEDQLLFPTVLDDAAFGLIRRGMPSFEAMERAQRILGMLGIEHLAHSSVHHLSHGQKQRVALAGALATDPSLLLLDEPSSGLDPFGKRALRALLSQLKAAVIIATHDLDFAKDLCTRFLLLANGHIMLDRKDAGEIDKHWQL